MKQAQTNTVH